MSQGTLPSSWLSFNGCIVVWCGARLGEGYTQGQIFRDYYTVTTGSPDVALVIVDFSYIYPVIAASSESIISSS